MKQKLSEKELRHIEDDVLVLGSLVEQALVDVIESLKGHDQEASRRLIAQGCEIIHQRAAIDRTVVSWIATQGPAAGGMRGWVDILQIAAELERMGTYAKGIGKICRANIESPRHDLFKDLAQMAEQTRDLLHRTLVAIAVHDTAMVRAILAETNDLEILPAQAQQDMRTLTRKHPELLDQVLYWRWIAYNLEQIVESMRQICKTSFD